MSLTTPISVWDAARTGATLTFPPSDSQRTITPTTGYRLARTPEGETVLQRAYQWSDGMSGGFEWQTLETFQLPTTP